jgi:hypothetical protein
MEGSMNTFYRGKYRYLLHGAALLFLCLAVCAPPAAATYQYVSNYNYSTYSQNGNEITFNTSGAPKVRLYMCFTNTVRVWMEPTGTFSMDPSYTTASDVWPAVTYTISDPGSGYIQIQKQT